MSKAVTFSDVEMNVQSPSHVPRPSARFKPIGKVKIAAGVTLVIAVLFYIYMEFIQLMIAMTGDLGIRPEWWDDESMGAWYSDATRNLYQILYVLWRVFSVIAAIVVGLVYACMAWWRIRKGVRFTWTFLALPIVLGSLLAVLLTLLFGHWCRLGEMLVNVDCEIGETSMCNQGRETHFNRVSAFVSFSLGFTAGICWMIKEAVDWDRFSREFTSRMYAHE